MTTTVFGSTAATFLTVVWTSVMQGLSTHDDGYIAAVLGVVTAVLGATTGDLRRRTRAALLLLGVGAIAVFLSFPTAAGIAMLGWFQD